jgi:NAD(P)-dependent dehydrogenase (short-subunit alcohol dehydrogenase family)
MPRTALVTGGASGLGAASAARLRADGLTVTTLDLSGAAGIGVDVTGDVTDEAALREIAARIGPGHGERHAGLRARHARPGLGPGRQPG